MTMIFWLLYCTNGAEMLSVLPVPRLAPITVVFAPINSVSRWDLLK